MAKTYAPEDALALKLFIVLARAYKAVSEHDQGDIRRHGLNPTEFAVLEFLYHKGPHPIQQIGDKILLTSGSTTYVIDKLEKKGLLERHPCPKDRRIIYGAITQEGREFFDRIFPPHIEALKKALSGLNDEEKQVAIELLKKLGKEAQRLTP